MVLSSGWFSVLVRTDLRSGWRPFVASCFVNSLGTIASSSTATPMLAKWHALRDPITPEPRTATFVIRRLSIVSCLMSKISNPSFRFILYGQLVDTLQRIDGRCPFFIRQVLIKVRVEFPHHIFGLDRKSVV